MGAVYLLLRGCVASADHLHAILCPHPDPGPFPTEEARWPPRKLLRIFDYFSFILFRAHRLQVPLEGEEGGLE